MLKIFCKVNTDNSINIKYDFDVLLKERFFVILNLI